MTFHDSTLDALTADARVVIIGGGIMGTSIAYHLAEAGVDGIAVVESNTLGSGSSGKPIGGVRAQFSDPTNIELGLRSLESYRRFAERPGADIGLEQVGYLFLLTDEAQLEGFASNLTIQHEFGIPSRMITADEVHELCPYVPASSVIAGSFCAIDGHARPWRAVAGYSDAARALGVRFLTNTEVTEIVMDGTEITAVETSAGTIRTASVICSAGAWSPRIGAMVGLDLPITPLKRQIAFTQPGSVLPRRVPFTLDFSTTAYFHNADGGSLLYGYADPAQEPGYDLDITEDWLDLFNRFARERAPELADAPVEKHWAGLYEMTPDASALVGEAPHLSRFLYAAGFSGHGFLQAPAVGEVMRDLFLERTPYLDISRFDAQRFAPDGTALTREYNVI